MSSLAFGWERIGGRTAKTNSAHFEGVHVECGFRCDLLIEGKLLIEVKTVEALNDIHKAQVLTYLKMTNTKLGLLMNFNTILLKDGIKRLVNNL